MNRALIFGIAIFFAVVGIALLGADNTVLAGHGCCGCNGGGHHCGGGCLGGLFGGHGCHGCHGGGHHNGCCGYDACGCCGNGYGGYNGGAPSDAPAAEAPPGAPPAAPAPSAYRRAPRSFRQVSFRR